MSVVINGKKSYVGCVIDMYEHNGYHDSYFYAIVVDVEKGVEREVEYDSTSHSGYGSAFIDVTPENYAKYLHHARQNYFKTCVEREVEEAKQVTKGKMVKVVKGRKVPHGVIGEVFWEKDAKYGVGYQSKEVTRIGIKDNEGNVYWTYAHNVEVVEYKKYMRKPQNIIKAAKATMSKKYMLVKDMSAN